MRGRVLRIGGHVLAQPGLSVGIALLLEIEADEALHALTVSCLGKFQILLFGGGKVTGAFRHPGGAEQRFRVRGIELSGLLIRGQCLLRLAFFRYLRQRQPRSGESLLAADRRLECDRDL